MTSLSRVFPIALFALALLSAPALFADDSPQGIENKLSVKKMASVSWDEVTIKEAISQIRRATDVNFVIDTKEVDQEDTITLELANLSAKNVLDILLSQKKLARATNNGVVWITSKDGAKKKEKIFSKVYDIRDVTNVIRNFKGPRTESGDVEVEESDDESEPETADSIKDLIEEMVEPEVWGNDGYGVTILKGQLIVSASNSVHTKVDELINQMRATK